MPDDNVTPTDPNSGQDGGQQDLKATVEALEKQIKQQHQQIAGYKGRLSQVESKAVTDRDAWALEKAGFEDRVAEIEPLQARIAELEPAQAKIGELETAAQQAVLKYERLHKLTAHPQLLTEAVIGLVESSTLEGEQLDAYIEQLSQQVVATGEARQQERNSGSTPPKPKSKERTSQHAFDEALKAGMGTPEYYNLMDEYYSLLDTEKGQFKPPTRGGAQEE